MTGLIGDTFILLYPMGGAKEDELTFLDYCCYHSTLFLISALYNGLIVRGAMGIGDYLRGESEYSVIGPAITDAMNWSEKSDWVGLNLTPSCGMILDKIVSDNPFKFGFIKYPMPLSNKMGGGRTLNIWCSAWPCLIDTYDTQKSGKESLSIKTEIIDLLRKNRDIPLGTESKYFNTLEFVDICINMHNGKSDI